MCERVCPECKSTDHVEQYGLYGTRVFCAECLRVFAFRADPEYAPLDQDQDAWAKELSWDDPKTRPGLSSQGE